MIRLRPVTDGDHPFLRDLYASTRSDEMAMVPWPDEQKQDFLTMQFEAQHIDYSTRFPGAEHSIVVLGTEDVGRIWIDRRDDEIRLLDIALLPESRDRAIGGDLLRTLQAEAAEMGIALRHSVARGNTDAMRFYRRLGFEVAEEWEMHDLMEWQPADVSRPTS